MFFRSFQFTPCVAYRPVLRTVRDTGAILQHSRERTEIKPGWVSSHTFLPPALQPELTDRPAVPCSADKPAGTVCSSWSSASEGQQEGLGKNRRPEGPLGCSNDGCFKDK